MTFQVQIEGAAAFKLLAAHMRAEGRKDLSRDMGRAISRATDPVRVAIAAEAEKVMPSEGGYRDLLTASLRHRLSRRLGGQRAQIILATYADGTKERRDIVALNKGNLRHPIYGRSFRYKVGARAGSIRRNGWAVTKIRPGFHDRGVAQAMELAADALMDVVEDYAGRLVGQ